MGYPSVTMAFDRWPPGDRNLWTIANRGGDILDEKGPAARWRASTRKQVMKDYGRLLFWQEGVGELDHRKLPSLRLTAETMDRYLEHLKSTGMASTSLSSRFQTLRQALVAMEPNADFSALDKRCAKLKGRAIPRRDEHAKLVDADDLWQKALAFYDSVTATHGANDTDFAISGADNQQIAMRRCCLARDALMVAVLAHHPLRLSNFAALALGTSLIQDRAEFWIHLSARVTKEKRPYYTAIDEDLYPYLVHYLAMVRSRLLSGGQSDNLWVAAHKTSMSNSAIYYQVVKMTERLFGHKINPHFFRKNLLTSVAQEAPSQVRAGSQILGHKDFRTGEKFYNLANSASAQRVYAALIRRLRGRLPRQPDARS